MPCFIYSFRQKIKSNFHRLLPLFLIPVFFFGSSLPSYAYSIPGNWFLPYSRLELRNGFQGSSTPNSNEFVDLSLNSQAHMDNPAVTSNGGQTWILQVPQYDLTNRTVFIFDARSYLITTESDFSFFPESVSLGFSDHSGNLTWVTPEDVHFFHRDAYTTGLFLGYTVIFTLPEGFENTFSRISFSGSGKWPDLAVSLYAYYPDSDSDSSASDLAAILAKLDDINDSIDNQTDEIMGAGSDNSGTIDNIQSGNSDLEDYISDYTEIEQSMHDKFVETQAALNGDFTGFSWGSLSTCLNWCSDYLQQIYLNSGDFKMMIVLPLLLGIALFFVGRGAVILANSNKSDKADNDK